MAITNKTKDDSGKTKVDYELETKPLEEKLQDAPAMIVEFRGQKKDTIRWNDKESGKPRSMAQLIVACETKSGDQLKGKLMGNDEAELPDLPFSKGDKVLFTLKSYSVSKGDTTFSFDSFMKVG